MKYSEVTFQFGEVEQWKIDLFVSELGEFGFDSFEEESQDQVKAFIPTSQLDIIALNALILRQETGLVLDYHEKELPWVNWNEEWEKNFQPIIIANKILVRAPFHQVSEKYEEELIIKPKMAFGTGHHQTTSMMLELMSSMSFTGKDVLDMGTGTGILAIYAVKRGAKNLLAIDIDSICVENVVENMERNQVTGIKAIQGSIEQIGDQKFDYVLANINRNIILDQIAHYVGALNENSELLLSGFYDGEDLQIIQEQAESLGLVLEEKLVKDRWCAARFIKRK